MSIGAGGGGSSQHSKWKAEDKKLWPGEFVNTGTEAGFPPLTLEQILGMLPQTTGLFGGGNAIPTVPRATTPAAVGASGGAENVLPQGAGVARAPDAPPTNTGMGLFNRTGLTNLGIGEKPTTYTPPPSVLTGVNPINAPTVTGVNASLSPTNYEDLQRSLFQANYDPAAAEINRQGAISDRSLNATLANAGLASSGAGLGQIQRQQQERGQQLGTLATTAASNAAVQRYGLQSSEQQANAGRAQEANLKSAGWSQDAQVQNAQNVLSGNKENAANYLTTLGLDQKSTTEARDAFLREQGIMEADLARLDQSAYNNIALAFNEYLKQYGILAELATEKKKGSSKGREGHGGIAVGYSGGGGATPSSGESGS